MATITLDIRQASRLSALRARLQRLYDRGQWDHASECADLILDLLRLGRPRS